MVDDLIPDLADKLRRTLKDLESAWQAERQANEVVEEAKKQSLAKQDQVQALSRLLDLYGVDTEAINNAHMKETKDNE